MSGKAPKQKGNRVERELVKTVEAYGLRAKRAWGSSGRSLGLPHNVDIVIEDDIRLQSKAKKKLPKALVEAMNEVDILVYREDGGRTVACVRLPVLLELIKLGLPVERDLIFKEHRDEQNVQKAKAFKESEGSPEGSGEPQQGAEQIRSHKTVRSGLQIKH